MKTLLARCLLLISLLACAGCAANFTPEETEAMRQAERLIFPGDAELTPKTIFSQLIVVVPQGDLRVIKIDGVPVREVSPSERQVVFLAPGKRTLTLSTDPELIARSGVVDPALESAMEPDGLINDSANPALREVEANIIVGNGSHCIIEYRVERDDIYVNFRKIDSQAALAEVATYLRDDTRWLRQKLAAAQVALKDLAAYQAFSRANPDWLEGKWAVGEDEDELEFSGRAVKFTQAKSMLISTRTTLEGTFMFDQNTLVLLWDSMNTFVNSLTREERPGFFLKTAWYYTRNGDTLEIKSNGMLVPVEIGGTYHKVR